MNKVTAHFSRRLPGSSYCSKTVVADDLAKHATAVLDGYVLKVTVLNEDVQKCTVSDVQGCDGTTITGQPGFYQRAAQIAEVDLRPAPKADYCKEVTITLGSLSPTDPCMALTKTFLRVPVLPFVHYNIIGRVPNGGAVTTL